MIITIDANILVALFDDKSFDKGFIKPIQRILSVRKWNAYETTNLEDLFGY